MLNPVSVHTHTGILVQQCGCWSLLVRGDVLYMYMHASVATLFAHAAQLHIAHCLYILYMSHNHRRTWLQKRGIPVTRLFDADTCISVYVGGLGNGWGSHTCLSINHHVTTQQASCTQVVHQCTTAQHKSGSKYC